MRGGQQPGDIIAAGQDDILELGAVVPRGSANEAPPLRSADLVNVVSFARARTTLNRASAPPVMVAPADRPAPPIADRGRFHRFALTAGSILIHSTLFISLWQMPNPTASLGVEVISMDVVLGANTAAGLAVAPAESETQDSVPVEEVRSEQQVAELEPVAPPEREEEKPTETPPAKQVVEVEPLPELKPPEPKKEQKQTQPSIASTASSGVGRGRSDPDTNYRGLVAAQLARHKQYPSAARSAGTQGTGTIAFTISSSGVVTSANIVKSTGVTSLDQELAAMVRRASPFPAPPGGREVSFTVPVTFRLH